jgi:hypothetical protein
MRKYSQADEEGIRTWSHVLRWTRSGLLDESSKQRIESDLGIKLRRTNLFLRAVLFVFTFMIVAASTALIGIILDIEDRFPATILCLVSAIGCLAATEYLISRFRLYRFGVEEAFAISSALFVTVAAVIIKDTNAETVALTVGGAAALGIYLRFNYLYAAAAAMICAAALPFQFGLATVMGRSLAAAILLSFFLAARSGRLRHGDDFPGDDYGILQAFALAGAYVSLNLQLIETAMPGTFYWITYVLIWIFPVMALRFALREKDRPLLDVSLGMALVTLITNKPYLGLARRPWDPIVFGVFLVVIAIAIRRWLAKSPNRERYGYTHVRLLSSDRQAMELLGTASAALQPGMPVSEPAASVPAGPKFGGGRSGGAGASGSF